MTIEAQLAAALAKITVLETDASAANDLLTEAVGNHTTAAAELETVRAENVTAIADRDAAQIEAKDAKAALTALQAATPPAPTPAQINAEAARALAASGVPPVAAALNPSNETPKTKGPELTGLARVEAEIAKQFAPK